jgi:hypothetical protein
MVCKVFTSTKAAEIPSIINTFYVNNNNLRAPNHVQDPQIRLTVMGMVGMINSEKNVE